MASNLTGDLAMNEAGKQSFHFNSNIRSKSGSKASMSNNEDRYLRALEIQELKREIREEELEKQRIIEEAEAKTTAEEKARQEAEAKAAEEETAKKAGQVEETAEPVAQESAPVVEAAPAAKPMPSGSFVPGPTPRKDFTSAEKAAMLKRAKAHAVEVAKRKGK